MARSTGVQQTLRCVPCGLTRRITWWYGDRADAWNSKTLSTPCSSCGASEWELPISTANGRVTARTNSAKVVVYSLPDGDFMVPEQSCPEMVATASSVGVRRELGSLAEVRQFCKDQSDRLMREWKQMDDEGLYGVMSPDFKQWQDVKYKAVMNDVLNYDERTIRETLGHMGEVMREERRKHEQRIARHPKARDGSIRLGDGSRMRIGRPEDIRRYERLKERGGRG